MADTGGHEQSTMEKFYVVFRREDGPRRKRHTSYTRLMSWREAWEMVEASRVHDPVTVMEVRESGTENVWTEKP